MLSARTSIRHGMLIGMFALVAVLSAASSQAQETDPTALQTAFADAAREFGVPERVLLAVSYNLSRWEDHGGQPSTSGGFGPMHLIDADLVIAADWKGDGQSRTTRAAELIAQQPTLEAAAKLLNVPINALKHDPKQNIRGGAALLAQYARETTGRLPESAADWYAAVVRYGGDPASRIAHQFADDVYATIEAGETRLTHTGQQITLSPEAVAPNRTLLPAPQAETSAVTDCPREITCLYAPAAYQQNDPDDPEDYGNYDLADRERDGLDIRYIVIHDTETPYYPTIRYFQNPRAYASSHYVLRSSDGQITQMVDNRDVAWTAGNWYINAHSINFEHEGYAIRGASWYTEAMYRTSARLTRYLADKYKVRLDRAHIIGHDEVPGTTQEGQRRQHWDPGPFWDWQHYMELVGAPIRAQGDGSNNIVTINPDFDTNQQIFTDASTQPANMVHLYTAPSASAPLIDDRAIPGVGTRSASDWGSKMVTGQQFYRFARQGDWDAIYYGGQRAWFYNPNGIRTSPGIGMLITPKRGRSSIPVYGAAYPATLPPGYSPRFEPLQYTIPAGQIYVAHQRVTGTYYGAPVFTTDRTRNKLITGSNSYYVISFNHRLGFVRAEDVDLVTGTRPPMPYVRYLPTMRTER